MSAPSRSKAFQAAAQPSTQAAKRPAPFSIRLTEEEKARLQQEAAGMMLGTYIKLKLLHTGPLKPAAAVVERKMLAQALALLGQSRIPNNLNQLAHLGNVGALPLTPEILVELDEARAHVREIKLLLMAAVGQKTGPLS